MESWHARRYRDAGLPGNFVQSNVSRSGPGVIRGLHYQNPQPQGKLVYVLEGRIVDVAVDIRKGSPTFGQWVGVTLSAEKHNQMVFRVRPDASKAEIRKAVELMFEVKVEGVQVVNVHGKHKRFGRMAGKRANWKKASGM